MTAHVQCARVYAHTMHTVKPHTKDSLTPRTHPVKFSSAAYLAALMEELDKAAICGRIKQARVEAGLEQQQLGDLLDPPVHYRTVQTWESAKQQRVPYDRLGEIAQVTGVTKEWLLHGDQVPTQVEVQADRLADAIEKLVVVLGRLDQHLAG